MSKGLRILRNRQGMTLVEVVVGMLLFTIIAASVTAVFVPLLKMYEQSNELAEINTLLDNLSDQMLNDLAMANAVSISGGRITVTTDLGNIAYYVYPSGGADTKKQGVLCRTNDVPILEKRYYKGKSVALAFLSESGAPITSSAGVTEPFCVRLTITSDKDGFEMASREYAVNPLSVVFKQYLAD